MGVSPAHVRQSVGRVVVRLAFELFVVFCGVYGAFALTEYREERALDERRAQFRQALATELRDITRNTRNAHAGVGQMIAAYDSLWRAGERPPLRPMLEPVRVQAHMWEATLQSDGLDLLDVRTIYQLSEFYNGLNEGFAQMEQLRTLSEATILPHLDEGGAAFYDPATGRLRARYLWYTNGLRNLRDIAGGLTELGDSLAATLDATGR